LEILMKKSLLVLLLIVIVFIFPASVLAGKYHPGVNADPGWEDEFIEGCRINGGLPFEWDYGLGCDFENDKDVFCTYDDQCDAGLLIDLDVQNVSSSTSVNAPACDTGGLVSLASLDQNGEVVFEEVCASGIGAIAKEEVEDNLDIPLEDLMNVEISTAGYQADKTSSVALEDEDDYDYDDFYLDCDLAGGTSQGSRMPNGDFYYECTFEDGDIIACDNFGCYPTPDSGFREVFPKLTAFAASNSLRAVAISDDDLDDLTELCRLDGGNAGSDQNGDFFCTYPGSSQEWKCSDDFWSEGHIKCQPVVHEDPEEKKSEAGPNGFPGEALNALGAVTINEAVYVPRIPKRINPVLLVQETSCRADQAEGGKETAISAFINNIVEMNGFFENIAGQNGIIAPNNLAEKSSESKVKGLGDISDGTSNTVMIIAPNNVNGRVHLDAGWNGQNSIIAPNNIRIPFPGGPIPIPYPNILIPISILGILGLGILGGGLYLSRVSDGMKIMELISRQPMQLAFGAGIGLGVAALTAGIGLAALFFIPDTGSEQSAAAGCSAVIVKTAKLDYLVTQPEGDGTRDALTVSPVDVLNCRFGPGTFYSIFSSMRPEDEAIVMGRNASREWYMVELTTGPNAGLSCWVWSGGLEDVSGLGDVEEVSSPSAGGDSNKGSGDAGGGGAAGGGGGGGGITEPGGGNTCISCGGGVVDPGGPPVIE
jgi:hypothetical protein